MATVAVALALAATSGIRTLTFPYHAHDGHVETAYLSLTRGDGGQNVLGPEFGDELGVIRTQEMLAARISLITASKFCSAFWKPSNRCSRSRALRNS